jgi:phosphoribosylaminoimidazole-succinocarboxamide synthase
MKKPSKQQVLYKGKAKTLYQTSEPGLLISEFRDDTTAFDGEKCEQLSLKGATNNLISAHISEVLHKAGVPTHFVSVLSDTESVVKQLKMIPLENVVRNIAAGSLCRRLGIAPNTELNPPLHELFLKNDELHDPMVNDNHALSFGWATEEQLRTMKTLSLKINEVLRDMFKKAGLILVDSKYEFGVGLDGKIYLGDEISPDSCRIWDETTRESLDKDRFRKDLGNVIESYRIIAERLGVSLKVTA